MGDDHNVSCFLAKTWPFKEPDVVAALKRKQYVRFVTRTGMEAGTDTDIFILQTNDLISAGPTLNLPAAISIFQNAIEKYFEDTGLALSEPISREIHCFGT